MADKLDLDQLGSIVDAEFESSLGVDGGEISTDRAENYDYYLRKKPKNTIAGQSQVITSDVADVIDGMMPSLLRIFTTQENLVSFEAVDADDEPAAEQESDYVNYVFFKQNPSFILTYNWFMDAGIQKNGIVKAWWDKSEKITPETYKGLTENQLFNDILSDEELEVTEQNDRTEIIEGVEVTVFDIAAKRLASRGRVRIENVPPEEYRISSDARSLDPSDARFVGQESEKKRHELIEMGFDATIVEDLPAHGELPTSPEDIARRDKSDETTGGPQDKSQDEILLREAYLRIDADGDGKAELLQIFTAGGQVLSKEVVDRQPFHVICPYPLPHKHFGQAFADKTKDIQDVKTVLTRQALDNTYHSNMPRTFVNEFGMGDHTMDDLLTVRPGVNVRVRGNPQENVFEPQRPFTAPNSLAMMQHYDKVKQERTGTSLNVEGLKPEDMKHIQQNVFAQATDPSKMKQEAVARIYVETGFKSLFLHIHELLRKHQDIPQTIELRNKWVEVDPTEWRTRENMTVNIGLGIGTREQNLLHIQAIRELQQAIVDAGGLGWIVSGKNIYNTAKELVKNANFKQPEEFFTDPGDTPAPPPSNEQMALQKQALQLQAEKQKLDAERQAINAQKQRLETEKAKADFAIEVQKLNQAKEKEKNTVMIELEKLANQLTEFELKFGKDVPGSKV
ncbi:hypothetical protein GWO43_15975 [candidate division KSB1 bacterium]|nr:hypothetical protein [candidate division KSB1 bacterium]NIV68730.1 hypothetical protein [Phycisphaerae bacterium]NIS25449.1 hypothetical protein [candidate division KSB1 bacterium]NIT72341.1 hypothetical protein [candidate division KSB1 bacterium]NIU26126.1 hypothetical protein [candidate division KSB1 bacterium]